MKNYRLVASLFVVLLFTLFASAQGRPGGGTGTGGGGGTRTPTPTPTPSVPTSPSTTMPDPLNGILFLFGKVVLDDGSALSEPVSIQTICNGQKHFQGYTDTHGGFSFQLGNRNPAGEIVSGDAELSGDPRSFSQAGNTRRILGCELLAVLPGFTSNVIELGDRISSSSSGSVDIGRLTLHRLQHVEGATISASSAAAPNSARKAFDKAREQEKNKKWDDAQKSLEKALAIYPRYAAAWFELGRLQQRNNDAVAARHSFEQALAIDAKYVNPYRGLADLDAQAKNWPELVDVTAKLLALNPVSFPDGWFYNAVGNYYLRNFEAAEKSARQGIKVDNAFQVPRLELLLGVLLEGKRNYTEAAEHIHKYQHLVTTPADKEEAQKQLAEIERLSAQANIPPANKETSDEDDDEDK